jgi:hypothetical protein
MAPAQLMYLLIIVLFSRGGRGGFGVKYYLVIYILTMTLVSCTECLIYVLGIVFIFRGEARDFGVKLTADDRTQRDGSSSVVLRSMSDILIGYSTLPGFTSNRDVYLGTWYIQAICEVFMEHAWNTDVEDMLKMVSLSDLSLLLLLGFWTLSVFSS